MTDEHPAADALVPAETAELVEQLLELSEGLRVDADVRDLIDEGRR